MWRQDASPGNFDSDQSISDEEDVNRDFGNNCVSLTDNTAKEEGIAVLSRLEMLQGEHELSSGKKISSEMIEKGNSCFADDDVEMPEFAEDDHFIHSPRKAFSHGLDAEGSSGNEDKHWLSKYSIASNDKGCHKDDNNSTGKQDRSTWSIVSKEAEALNTLNANAVSSCSANSKASKSCKGSRKKMKPKFSFHVQLHTEKLSQAFILKDESVVSPKLLDVANRTETFDHEIVEDSSPELQQNFGGRDEDQLEIVLAEGEALQKRSVEHSMAELLDGVQDKNFLSGGTSKMHSKRGKRAHLLMERNLSALQDRTIDSQEQPENVASGSSSDDECNVQNLNLPGPEMKRQTMADRFQDALAATSLNNEAVFSAAVKASGIGLFAKLQQVMQSEKERDVLFLDRLQMGTTPNGEEQSMLVKIMSRYLDAKLTVCRCYIGRNTEGSYWSENPQTLVARGRTVTVVFSSRVCVDVDLEVGNLICIHPPWKEVPVMGGDEIIILATYFSRSTVIKGPSGS